MTEKEIDNALNSMEELLGAELTSLCYDEKALQLRFEKPERYWWVTFSLKSGPPYFFFISSRVFLIRSLKKPLTIFLRTHFVGQNLKNLCRLEDKGRVVELEFDQELYIRASLFPGGQNIQLLAHGKKLFAYKPKELKLHEKKEGDFSETRPSSYFFDLWQKTHKSLNGKNHKKSEGDSLKKDIRKKENGLKKMKEKLRSYENSQWLSLGNWLKENQKLEDVPKEWQSFIDKDKTLAWNIENSFKQHKKDQSKIEGTKSRMNDLEKEIEELTSGTFKKKQTQKQSLMVQTAAKGRTFELGGGKLYIGKSAKDNLSLLRRAKPWYLWLHIRDYPGAYGIVELQKKGKDLPLEVLQKAAKLVVKQSVGEKAGGTYQVLTAECRYVRPIKGAKSGQVTYSHEKLISVKV